MIVRLDKVITTLDGEPVTGDRGKPMTIGDAALLALTATAQNESPDGLEKFRRYELAKKLKMLLEVDLSPEEVAKLKERVGAIFNVVVVGRVWDALDGKEGPVDGPQFAVKDENGGENEKPQSALLPHDLGRRSRARLV